LFSQNEEPEPTTNFYMIQNHYTKFEAYYQWVHTLVSWSGTASIAEDWNNLEKEERDGDSDYTSIGRIRFGTISDSG